MIGIITIFIQCKLKIGYSIRYTIGEDVSKIQKFYLKTQHDKKFKIIRVVSEIH